MKLFPILREQHLESIIQYVICIAMFAFLELLAYVPANGEKRKANNGRIPVQGRKAHRVR